MRIMNIISMVYLLLLNHLNFNIMQFPIFNYDLPLYDLTYIEKRVNHSKHRKASVLRCIARYKKRRLKR